MKKMKVHKQIFITRSGLSVILLPVSMTKGRIICPGALDLESEMGRKLFPQIDTKEDCRFALSSDVYIPVLRIINSGSWPIFPFEELPYELKLLILDYVPLIDICSFARTCKMNRDRMESNIGVCKSIRFYLLSHHRGLWKRYGSGEVIRICKALRKIQEDFFNESVIPWDNLCGEFEWRDEPNFYSTDDDIYINNFETVDAHLLLTNRDEEDNYYDPVYSELARLDQALRKISIPKNVYKSFLISKKIIRVNLANALNSDDEQYYFETRTDSQDETNHFIIPRNEEDIVIGGRGYEAIQIRPSFFLSDGIFQLNFSILEMHYYVS